MQPDSCLITHSAEIVNLDFCSRWENVPLVALNSQMLLDASRLHLRWRTFYGDLHREKRAGAGLIRALLQKTAAGLQLDIRLMRAQRANISNKAAAIKAKRRPGRGWSAALTDYYQKPHHLRSPETHYTVITHR